MDRLVVVKFHKNIANRWLFVIQGNITVINLYSYSYFDMFRGPFLYIHDQPMRRRYLSCSFRRHPVAEMQGCWRCSLLGRQPAGERRALQPVHQTSCPSLMCHQAPRTYLSQTPAIHCRHCDETHCDEAESWRLVEESWVPCDVPPPQSQHLVPLQSASLPHSEHWTTTHRPTPSDHTQLSLSLSVCVRDRQSRLATVTCANDMTWTCLSAMQWAALDSPVA